MIIAPTIARKHSNASVVFEVHCWGITWIWKWSLFVINHKKSVYFNQSNIVLFMKMIALGTGNSHDCGPLPVHTITPPRNEHWHKKKFVLIKKGRFQKRERGERERGGRKDQWKVQHSDFLRECIDMQCVAAKVKRWMVWAKTCMAIPIEASLHCGCTTPKQPSIKEDSLNDGTIYRTITRHRYM